MPEIVFLGVGGMPGGERNQDQYEYSFYQRGEFVRCFKYSINNVIFL